MTRGAVASASNWPSQAIYGPNRSGSRLKGVVLNVCDHGLVALAIPVGFGDSGQWRLAVACGKVAAPIMVQRR